jgi:GNAT superfamily N-acetyltransferase
MNAAPAVTIREATESDLPDILALIGQPEMDGGDVLALADAQALFRKMRRYPDYRMFVASREDGDGSHIVGCYALLIMDNLGHRGAPSAIVEEVLVAPADHGCGIGRAMLHDARRRAKIAGCYKLMLSSNIKRERAHAFYDSLGFERHGISFRIDLTETGTP